MNRRRDETIRLGDFLASLNLLSRANEGQGGRPDMLIQRQDQPWREGQAPDRKIAGAILMVVRMNSTLEAKAPKPLHVIYSKASGDWTATAFPVTAGSLRPVLPVNTLAYPPSIY